MNKIAHIIKNNKKKIIMAIILIAILVLLLSSKTIINRISEIFEKEELLEFEWKTYEVSGNMGTAQVIFRNENGIDKILYPEINGERFELYPKGKSKVSIDYQMEDLKDYEFKLIDKNGTEKTYTINYEINIGLEYIQDGLLVWYDGNNNTGNGHSSTTETWKNLAPIAETNNEENNDGTLRNVEQTETSGWTENSLILDGVDDWVGMSHMYSENMTIEIVVKPLSVKTSEEAYFGELENGGIAFIQDKNRLYSCTHINGYGYRWLGTPEDEVVIGKKYSLSTGYNGSNNYFRINENTRQSNISGGIGEAANSTIFAIGVNTRGNSPDNSYGYEARSNIEVYSVRVYNRCLTEEERQLNYEVDKAKFNI